MLEERAMAIHTARCAMHGMEPDGLMPRAAEAG
jgi:hypothetical protein